MFIPDSKSDWEIPGSAWMNRELSQDLMEPVGCGGIPAGSGSKSSMILKNNCLWKNVCVGSSKGKQNLSSCFTGFGFPPARGEILDDKTSAQHKFLGVKINPWPRIWNSLWQVHSRADESWEERWIRPPPFTGCDSYNPIRIMFSISWFPFHSRSSSSFPLHAETVLQHYYPGL